MDPRNRASMKALSPPSSILPFMPDLLRLIEGLFNQAACDLIVGDADCRVEIVLSTLTAIERHLAAAGADATPVLAAIAGARSDLPGLGAEAAFERAQAGWHSWREAVVHQSGFQAAATAPFDEAGGARSGDRLDADRATLALDPEFAGIFITDSLEHLGTIEAAVLALEAAPQDEALINEVFRPFHTVKGNAGALNVSSVQELAHRAESLLDLARAGKHRLAAVEFDIILKTVDLLTAHILELRVRLAGGRERDLDAARARLMDAIDRLLQGGGGVVASPAPANEDAPAAYNRRAEDQPGSAAVKVDTRKLDHLVDMVGELVIAQTIVEQDTSRAQASDERLARNLAHLRRITTDLQRTVMSLRMVPVRQTFQRTARLVRDLGKQSGKLVDLTLVGEDTELDRRLVEDIAAPLMHMVRNSIDHGIEDADARERAGKPRRAQLTISARHQGSDIAIAVTDDGAGLDTAKIRARAIANGLITAGDALAAPDVHQLIFKAGFTTADIVTDLSGRGVGMDVVRRTVEALRGRIDVQTTPGRGTTFLLRLPLTLAIVDGLLLQVGSERFVVPMFSVAESLRAQPQQVHTVQGHTCVVRVRDRLLPLVRLADLFGIGEATSDPAQGTIVVLEADDRHIAVMVDSLLGKQEVVIKSLGPSLANVRGIAGCAILGDGRVGLILDAAAIVRSQYHDHVTTAA